MCIRSSDVHRLVSVLAADRIIVSSRDDNIRIATHFYNSGHDVNVVLDALKKHRQLLA